MFRPRYISGLVLLLHLAFSMLGSGGVHSVLGCRHEHADHNGCSVGKAEKHRHKGCCHPHSHTHPHRQADPKSDEQPHRHGPLTDDGCAICQAFTRPAEVAVSFELNAVELHCIDEVAAPVVRPLIITSTDYDVRGPPAVA